MTCIPISNPSYRRANPTKAKAKYEYLTGLHTFTLTDDWGRDAVVEISDDEDGQKLAQSQIESLVANELMQPLSTQQEIQK